MPSSNTAQLLSHDDPGPVGVETAGADSPFLLVCDHAGRAVPTALAGLGLTPGAMDRHIAWDLGALDLARAVAHGLGATLIHQVYSRLVIDCNRSPDHAGSIVTESDGVGVPGNRDLTPAAAEARRREIFAPYHARIAAELSEARRRRIRPLLVSIHSFTDQMDGVNRPWHVGVLHMGESPASDAMLSLLRAEGGLIVGDNEPYAMDGVDFTVPFHALSRGADALELEIRQDLLASDLGVRTHAERLCRLLPAVLERG